MKLWRIGIRIYLWPQYQGIVSWRIYSRTICKLFANKELFAEHCFSASPAISSYCIPFPANPSLFQPFWPFSFISSHIQTFPAMSSQFTNLIITHFQPSIHFQAYPAISRQFKPFQPFSAIPFIFQPFPTFASLPSISSHLQLIHPFTAVSNLFMPFPAISSHFQPFPASHSARQCTKAFCRMLIGCSGVSLKPSASMESCLFLLQSFCP